MVPDLDPGERPAFFDEKTAAAVAYAGEPDAIPLFDHELLPENPDVPVLGVQNRYREIARRHAFGQTNNQIAHALGYTASRISIILRDPFVQSEINRWRDQLFDSDVVTRMKEVASDAVTRLHGLVLDPQTDDRVALSASQFAIEKVTGKAKQEISVESGSLAAFTELLKEMKARGEVLDVTPQAALPEAHGAEGHAGKRESAAQQTDHFTAWIKENV
jgi:hypothetical protein